MQMFDKFRRSAFTLAELLIVVSIIILLASILAPSFNGIHKRAVSARCASNLHQIGAAFGKNKADTTGGSIAKIYPAGDIWPGTPYTSVKTPGVFACPSLGETVSDAHWKP